MGTAPNMAAFIEGLTATYPKEWEKAKHEGDDGSFIRIVAQECHDLDDRWGLNAKRDGPDEDISKDCIAWYVGPTDRHVEVYDVIVAHESASAHIGWNDITGYDTMGEPGTARYVHPYNGGGYVTEPETPPEPEPTPEPEPPPATGPIEVSFLSHHQMYVCAEEGGGVYGESIGDLPKGILIANRETAGLWETFTLTQIDGSHIYLRSSDGSYVTAEGGGGSILVANRQYGSEGPGPWETLAFEPQPDGTVALRVWGGQYVTAELNGSMNAVRAYESPGPWELFTPSVAWWKGAEVPPGVAWRRIVGPLQCFDGSWRDGQGQAVNPCGVHAGDLFICYTEGRDTATQLREFASMGYQWVRFWAPLMWFKQAGGIWNNRGVSPDVTPDYYGQLRGFIRQIIDAGLLVHLSIGDLNNVSQGARDDLYDQYAEIVAEFGVQHFYCPGEVNEARDVYIGASAGDVEHLVQKIRSRNGSDLYTLSGYTGDTTIEIVQEWTPEWAPYYYFHGYRAGHWYDKVRHLFSDGYEYYSQVRPYGYTGEDVGPGKNVSVTENQHELDQRVMLLLSAAAMTSRIAYCYFSSPGVVWDEPFTNMPGYAAMPQFLSLLPADVQTYETQHHGGDTWAHLRVLAADGETRCDGRTAADGRFVCLIYGPEEYAQPPISRNFDGHWCDPSTLEVNAVSGQAGQRMPSLKNGYLLWGKAR
jgi:hypothetical protein